MDEYVKRSKPTKIDRPSDLDHDRTPQQYYMKSEGSD